MTARSYVLDYSHKDFQIHYHTPNLDCSYCTKGYMKSPYGGGVGVGWG